MTPDRIIKQAMRPHRASAASASDGEGGQRRRRRVTRLSNLRFRAYEIITYSLFVRSFSCSTFHSVSPFPLFWRSGIRSPLLSASISPLGSRQSVIQFSRLHAPNANALSVVPPVSLRPRSVGRPLLLAATPVVVSILAV